MINIDSYQFCYFQLIPMKFLTLKKKHVLLISQKIFLLKLSIPKRTRGKELNDYPLQILKKHHYVNLLLKKTYWKQCRIVCEEQKLLGK